MHIVVDGYNLIRQSEVLRRHERISLEEGRRALVRLLSGFHKSRGHRITAVFDGWAGGSPDEERDVAGGVHIIYSRLGEKADEVIRRLLAEGSEELLVVTSDRAIVSSAARQGRATMTSPAFASVLEKIAAGNFAVGASGTEFSQDDGERIAKRKGPSRRLSKKKRASLARINKL